MKASCEGDGNVPQCDLGSDCMDVYTYKNLSRHTFKVRTLYRILVAVKKSPDQPGAEKSCFGWVGSSVMSRLK